MRVSRYKALSEGAHSSSRAYQEKDGRECSFEFTLIATFEEKLKALKKAVEKGYISNKDYEECKDRIQMDTVFTSLLIFGLLAIRYRNIRSFEFQIFVFIIVYIVGEILEDYKVSSLSTSLPYVGSPLHIVSAVFLAIILWLRLYYVRRSGRKMIDKLEPVE